MNNFIVINVIEYEGFYLFKSDIDISDYTEKTLENEVKSYYNSLNELKDIYKYDWKQIVAEIISENESTNIFSAIYFKSEDHLFKYLNKNYGIIIRR